jgi:TDG/mug DNA glycosylase family protein
MEPMIDSETRILIVGTFPGQISRELNQYYADSRNQFWKIMKIIFDIDFVDLSYEDKIKILQENRIGLWDTLEKCDVIGSSDNNIRNEEYNDFSKLMSIKKIVCNGQKAEKYLKKCLKPGNYSAILAFLI